MEELISFAKKRLNEADRCGEDVTTLRYWAGYIDGVRAAKKKVFVAAMPPDRELIPCPFCMGEAELVIKPHIPASRGYDYTPRCKDPSCPGRLTKKWNNRDTAVYAWNRRGSGLGWMPDYPDALQVMKPVELREEKQ